MSRWTRFPSLGRGFDSHRPHVSKDHQLTSRDEAIERLKLLIAKLRRMQFGRKSEKLDRQIEQLELRLDKLEASRAQQRAASPDPLSASVDRPQDRDATLGAAGQAMHDNPLGKPLVPLFDNSPKPLPARPQLLCSKCDFQNDNPERLAEHLIAVHSQMTAAAWFEAGQENERLYPRLRAQAGEFTVLGMDTQRSRGNIIASCASLSEAIALADQAKAACPEITVYDDSGRERYRLASEVHISPSSSAATDTVSSEPPVHHQQQLQSTTMQVRSDEEVIRSFLLKGKQDHPPKFVVIAGPVATGKTTLRRTK